MFNAVMLLRSHCKLMRICLVVFIIYGERFNMLT